MKLFSKFFCHTRGLDDYFQRWNYPEGMDSDYNTIAAKLQRSTLALFVAELRQTKLLSKQQNQPFPILTRFDPKRLDAYQEIYDAHVRVKVLRQARWITANTITMDVIYRTIHNNPSKLIHEIRKTYGSNGFWGALTSGSASRNTPSDVLRFLGYDHIKSSSNILFPGSNMRMGDGEWKYCPPVKLLIEVKPTSRITRIMEVPIPANWDTCDWRGNVLLRCVIQEILRAQQPASSEPRHA